MNRRELLLSAAAGSVLAVTPRALARTQKAQSLQTPGVYVQDMPMSNAILGAATGGALLIGPLSSTLRTGATASCYSAAAPAGFDRAQARIDDFFGEGGETLTLVQAANGADGLPDYEGNAG